MSSAAAKDAWYHTKETVLGLLILAVPLALVLMSLGFVYQSSCRVEPATLHNQYVENGSLYVELVQEPDLYFEGETEKIKVERFEPVAVRWCPTVAGDRVRGVMVP